MLSTKVALVALVSVIVVCGYPIGGPPDALDQKLRVGDYEDYIRNLEKKQRFSYNEIDETLQPVLEDDDVELSLLAQPVSQPPSDDGFGRSTSRPIAPSKDSSAEADKSDEAVEDERHDSSESGQVEKDSSSEHGPVEDESAEDSEVTLESVNEKQEESQQDPENLEQDKKPSPVGDEESPVAEAVQEGAGSEIAVGSDIVTELPQVQDEVAQPEEQVVALEASDVSQDSPLPATDFPVAFVAQEEPKIEIEVPQEQAEDVSSDDGSGSPSTDATAQFDENPEVVLDETATSVSVTENDEGSGSLAADAEHVAEQEKQSVAHADELEGSGLSVADALPEDGIVASDGLNEEGSGFLTADAPNGNEEGSGLLIPTEEIQSDALSAEGSGSADEAKVESPEQLNESEQVVVALTEADGSGDAGEPVADDESTVGPSVENDEASGSGPVSSVPEGDHPELSDDSPIKEEAKIEEVADDAVKFIPVEVIVDTDSQLDTEQKVNEPETTEATLKVETGAHQSEDTAALPQTLPEVVHTETVEQDQPSEVEKLLVPDTDLIADNAESTSEQPQGLMQSDDFIPAAAGPQRSSRLLF